MGPGGKLQLSFPPRKAADAAWGPTRRSLSLSGDRLEGWALAPVTSTWREREGPGRPCVRAWSRETIWSGSEARPVTLSPLGTRARKPPWPPTAPQTCH